MFTNLKMWYILNELNFQYELSSVNLQIYKMSLHFYK